MYLACAPVSSVESGLQVSIPEILPLVARKSGESEKRLNLVIPALSAKHVFGGISTALHFFHEMAASFENVRIIITDEVGFTAEDNSDFADWEILNLADADRAGRLIVSAGDRSKHTLSIRESDIFIATAWWTASLVKKLLTQRELFWSECKEIKFIYLIQDYEPGFYPWSSRYALAEASYHDSKDSVAIFNTSFLKRYFDSKGYVFWKSFVFEPILNKKLRAHLLNPTPEPRKRNILIYGRPSVNRNCFELLVMTLRVVVSKLNCTGWTFYSAGEPHADITLGNGFLLKSLGKLTIEEYGHQLQETYAGISLMVSPHPSYPPLEMAAFGIKVLTNAFEEKNLSALGSNIYSISSLSAESVAEKLISIMGHYESDPYCYLPNTPFFHEFRQVENPFEHITSALVDMIEKNWSTSQV